MTPIQAARPMMAFAPHRTSVALTGTGATSVSQDGLLAGKPRPVGEINPQEVLKGVVDRINPQPSGKKVRPQAAGTVGTAVNASFAPRAVKLEGDRQVILRARNNGQVFISFPNGLNLQGKSVSRNVPDVTVKNTPQQIQQAVRKLCANPRVVPYVYDSGNRPIPNANGRQAEIDQRPEESKTIITERENFMGSISGLPAGVKEVAGFLGGIWFETLGKLGLAGEQLIKLQQATARQITASPAAWKTFIDSNFSGNDAYAGEYRKHLSSFPSGGAGDVKTTLAIALALDRKAATKFNELGRAIETDPLGVGKKLLKGLKEMVKQEAREIDPKNHSNLGGFLGTLAAKLVTSWIPAAKGGAAGAKLLASLAKNSPNLLKAMGKVSYEGAIATLQKANARLTLLASKAKAPGGVSTAEKAQQTALVSQVENTAKAIADNDPGALKAAVEQTRKTLAPPVTSSASNKNPAVASTAATLSAASLKDRANQARTAANEALKNGEFGKLAVQMAALRKIQNECRQAGQNGLADAIEVHIKHMGAQRKALHRENTAPQYSATARPPSNAALTNAMRISAVSSNARSIENPKQFLAYINNLNGQPLSTVSKVGVTGVQLIDTTLAVRTESYKALGIGDLVTSDFPTIKGIQKHDWHLVFGAPSKVGELHASSRSFHPGSKESWAQRGQLPGKGNHKISEFWIPDFTDEFADADIALTTLGALTFDVRSATFSDGVFRPLRQTGFIPKGSALATRLERFEATLSTRTMLATQVRIANPSELPALTKKFKAADEAVKTSVKLFAAQATQLRSELLIESLGSPKTTYEMTIRHAAGARYMASVENQIDPVFDATKFKQILGAVKVEAGPEAATSLKWHRELVKTYESDDAFANAMQQSQPMRDAWAAYKAKYGL